MVRLGRRFNFKRRKKLIFWLAFSLLAGALIIYGSNRHVIESTEGRIFSQPEKLPVADVGLLLGTSRYAKGGGENLFFSYRIEAAAELFRSGKIKHILVSGDNSVVEYNEPREMRKALVLAGIPDSCITLDFAGFRTYDSVVRARAVFGQEKLIIISQRFHLQRAVYLAGHNGIEAWGYESREVPGAYSYKTYLREYLAKFLAVLDVYVLPTKPKFLGEEVTIKV